MNNQKITYAQTRDMDLAAVATTLGFEMTNAPHVIQTERGRQYTFFFDETNCDGDISFAELLRAMNAPEAYIDEHPNEPMSYAIAALLNRKAYLSHIKDFKSFVLVESNGARRLIPSSASEGKLKQYLSL